MSDAAETPYRSAPISIDALAEKVEKLEKQLAILMKEYRAHHHGQRDVSCPKCGRRYTMVITKPWTGLQCSKKACQMQLSDALDEVVEHDAGKK